MVQKYSFDGIRIDAMAHVPKDFWGEFSEEARVFQIGEVLKEDPLFVAPY